MTPLLSILIIAAIIYIVLFGLYCSKEEYRSIMNSREHFKCIYLCNKNQDRSSLHLRKKFWSYLEKVRKEEQIYFKLYDTIEELNAEDIKDSSFDKSNMAAGCYTYIKKMFDTPQKRLLNKLPLIELIKESPEEIKNNELNTVWVYAHELGHHFAIKEDDDTSEEAANRWIEKLARRCFNDYEIALLEVPITIHSGVKLSEGYKLLDAFAYAFADKKVEESCTNFDNSFCFGLGNHFRFVINKLENLKIKQKNIDIV